MNAVVAIFMVVALVAWALLNVYAPEYLGR